MTEPSAAADALIGQVLQDRYRVVRLLGEGGMGAVYEVEHVRIGRRLALKRLHAELARDETILARFQREAQAATMVGNKHIVEVTDMGELPDGAPYIVLEYLVGEDAAALLRREAPLAVHRVVDIVLQVCDGLAAAHRKGIVHRDLKPENLFLVADAESPDFVKILDFGISKIREEAEANKESLTATGMALGTPVYMSVEQAHGRKDLDGRADIYALGVILYKLLTGRPPFEAETYASLMVAILTEDPPSPRTFRPEVPEGLERIVSTCMEKERGRRYQTATELAEALAPFGSGRITLSPLGAEGETSPARPATPLAGGQAGDLDAPTLPAGGGEATVAATPRARPAARAGEPAEAAPSDEGAPAAASRAREPEPGAEPGPERAASRPAAVTDTGPTDLSWQAEAAAPARRPSRRLPLLVGLGLGAVALAAAALLWRGAGEGPTEEPSGPAAVAPPADAAPAPLPGTGARAEVDRAASGEGDARPAPPTEVRVRISATPEDARIFIGGVEVPNPMDASQPRSLAPVRIRVERAGRRTVEQLAIFDQDRTFTYELERGSGVRHVESPAAPPAGHAASPPAPPAATPGEATPTKVYEGPTGTIRDSFE